MQVPTEIFHCLKCGKALQEIGYDHPMTEGVHIFKTCANTTCEFFGLLQLGNETMFSMKGGEQKPLQTN